MRSLEQAILDYREYVLKEGRQEGKRKGLCEALQLIYQARFGHVSAELQTLIENTVEIERLNAWLPLFATADADRILQQLTSSNP